MSAADVTLGTRHSVKIDAGPFRVSSMLFPAGGFIAPHYHDQACVSVVVAGRFLQRFPGKSYECPEGGVIAKPPGERHDDRWFDADSRHLIVEIDPQRHHALGGCRRIAEEVFHDCDAGAIVLAQAMIRELEESDTATPIALEGLVFQLFARLHRRQLGAVADHRRPAWLTRMREYLHDHYNATIRLQDLATEVGVHPDHASRVFSEVYGESFGSYLRRVRVEAAVSQLSSTSLPISDIAYRCGFSDQSHLTRVFKRVVGVTPGAYRESRETR